MAATAVGTHRAAACGGAPLRGAAAGTAPPAAAWRARLLNSLTQYAGSISAARKYRMTAARRRGGHSNCARASLAHGTASIRTHQTPGRTSCGNIVMDGRQDIGRFSPYERRAGMNGAYCLHGRDAQHNCAPTRVAHACAQHSSPDSRWHSWLTSPPLAPCASRNGRQTPAGQAAKQRRRCADAAQQHRWWLWAL